MRYFTRIVVDSETLQTLERVKSSYQGPAHQMKGKTPAPSAVAQNTGLEEQQFAQGQQASAKENQAKAQGSLEQFEGPVTQSPFYKALLNQGIESTSNAYGNTLANARARANASGYGYAQPAEGAMESGIQSQEAQTLAGLPAKTALETAPLTMEAAGRTAEIGSAQAGEGIGAAGVSTEGEKTGSDIELARNAQFGNIWKTLAGVGLDAATVARI